MADRSPSLERNPDLDAWIRIHADGRVTLRTGKVELGQGIRTALAWIAAEELDVEISRVQVRTADTAEGPNELITAGSSSIEDSGTAVRQAAATARALILERASSLLGAPAHELEVDDGDVIANDGRRTSYWELFGDRDFGGPVSPSVRPKMPDAYRRVGTPAPRLEMPDLVTGRAVFVGDLELPEMLHGRVVRPPGLAATLESLDDTEVRRLPGVVSIVRDGRFLGVITAREEQAVRAQDALRDACRWQEPEALPGEAEVFVRLREGPHESLLVVDGTPVDAAIPEVYTPAGTVQALDARYERPHQMHASLGPSAALARQAAGELCVWTHSQGVHVLRHSLAQALGREADSIRVIHVPGPGCYGHNGADDAALDAALLALEVPGRPVLLKWTRDDEHAWEPYGPAMVVDLRGSLDANGDVIYWSHDVYSNTHMGRPLPYGERSNLLATWLRHSPMPPPAPRPSLGPHAGIHRNADPLYWFPERRIVKHLAVEAPLRVSSTRSLGAYANVFAIESFMDELAHAAGIDPIDFRLRQLRDARARAVIEAAAERAGWGRDPVGPGRGRGIGFARYKNAKAYAAVVIEIRVDSGGEGIQLERAVIAADAGQIVDPSGLASQLEGGVIQSASWTLLERVRFDRRRITSRDWETYPILGFHQVPEVETVLLDRPGEPSLGCGEAAQGPTAAAIANAVFAATGRRLRRLPLVEALRAPGSGS